MVQIDRKKFLITHRAFENEMEEKGGQRFRSFGHQHFMTSEVLDKLKSLQRGGEILQFSNWRAWASSPGRIVAALKDACKREVSGILMEHKYGEMKSRYVLSRLTSSLFRRQCDSPTR